LWVRGAGQREHRPDRVGIIFDVALSTELQRHMMAEIEKRYDIPAVLAREVWPGAFSTRNGKHVLELVRERAIVLLVYADPRTMGRSKPAVIGPPKVQDTVEEFVIALMMSVGVLQVESPEPPESPETPSQ